MIERRQGVDLQSGRDIILDFQLFDRLVAIATLGLDTGPTERMRLSFDLLDDNQSDRLGDGDRAASVPAVTVEGQTRNSLVIDLVEAMNMPHTSAQTITLFGVTELAPDAIGDVGSRSVPVFMGTDDPEAIGTDDEALDVLAHGGNDSVQGVGLRPSDGGDGDDVLEGNGREDQILGDAGRDVLTGGTGEDVLQGGSGNDVLRGGPGEDLLRGEETGAQAGDDRLEGGDGDDRLHAGPGNDLLIGGGEGHDQFLI